jgi:hypothetical protein
MLAEKHDEATGHIILAVSGITFYWKITVKKQAKSSLQGRYYCVSLT